LLCFALLCFALLCFADYGQLIEPLRQKEVVQENVKDAVLRWKEESGNRAGGLMKYIFFFSSATIFSEGGLGCRWARAGTVASDTASVYYVRR
jgi:hypothetical protein